MNRQRLMILGIIALALLVWGIDLSLHPVTWSGMVLRKQLIYLSGLMAFLFMGLILVLSIRPCCLERWFGGLDQMYALHKWAGILPLVLPHYTNSLKLANLCLPIYLGLGLLKGQNQNCLALKHGSKVSLALRKILGNIWSTF